MKKLLFAALFSILPVIALAQLPQYPYPEFTPGRVISSAEVNANNLVVADNALKRNGGGIIEGHITADTDITIDGVDLDDFLSGGRIIAQTPGVVGTPAFSATGDTSTGLYAPAVGQLALSLSGVQQLLLNAGMTVRGTAIFNSSGKIPAITSTYFANLDAQDLQPGEASFANGTLIARQPDDETITGAYLHAKGTITVNKPLTLSATWNNSGITFTGADVSITNTASNAASRAWNVSVGGTTRVHTLADGTTVISAPRITDGAINLAFLVGDANGTGFWALSAASSPVPVGMFAWFEGACPTAWTIKSDGGNTYHNKTIRGGATFVASGGADTHSHTVDYPSTTSTFISADHTHTADPANTTSTSAGDHNHSIANVVGSLASGGGSHTHTSGTGGPSSFGDAPLGATNVAEGHVHAYTSGSTGIAHTHDDGSYQSNNAGGHTHDTNFALTASGGVSVNHQHNLDVANTSSSTDSNIPAFVQVVVCRKD